MHIRLLPIAISTDNHVFRAKIWQEKSSYARHKYAYPLLDNTIGRTNPTYTEYDFILLFIYVKIKQSV